MKKLLLVGVIALLVCSCNNKPTASISATIIGANDSTKLELKRYNVNKLQEVDTIITNAEGKFTYKVKLPNDSPNFYYLYFCDTPVAILVLLPGDNVELISDSLGLYNIVGSEESQLLLEANKEFSEASYALDELAAQAIEANDQAKIKEINTQMGRVYVNQKRNATRRVLANPGSITSATILFQKFNDNLLVFPEATDMILFQRVRDSLAVKYPHTEYLSILDNEIQKRKSIMDMTTKLSDAQTVGFPDLVMPDIDGKDRMLSESKGKVIILSFWSVSQNDHKMFNNDLLAIYNAYHDKGLEIFQIALDVDKPAWAATVKAQNLPWISVNDGYGTNSSSIIAYNIEKIPSMFIIDRGGDIVGKDIFDKQKLESAIKKLL
ncbi:MAG: TlpA disulfide reductase family protein [Bacteroidales bacterium]|nr:TlpA disulfide reductase family protein [Bacteroidales bacterium]